MEDYTRLGTIPTNKNELRPEIDKIIMNANRSTCTEEPISAHSRKK